MRIEISPGSHVVSDTLESDTIVIDIRTGAYYTLTPNAGRTWQKIQQDSSHVLGVDPNTDAIISSLLTEGLLVTKTEVAFDAPPQDVIAFTKYTDMEELLLADPIHEVSEDGWPIGKSSQDGWPVIKTES